MTVRLDEHYVDSRLVATYDIENSSRDDVDHYLRLAERVGAHSVIDLGCGTGVLATDLASCGRRVIGVDPADAMLEVARRRDGGARVTWVNGTSEALPGDTADLVLITGHAAQVFLDEDEWRRMLADCRRALRAGGHLAFETRNPTVEGWRSWTREQTFATYTMADGSQFDSWVEVTGVRLPLVDFAGHIVFHGEAERLVPSTLRFRTRTEIENSLLSVGFDVVEVVGDWFGSPATTNSAELIFLATAVGRNG